MSFDRRDIHQQITHQLIAMFEKASGTFELPWHTTGGASVRPINVASKQPYRGINVLALWAAADARGYNSGVWGTYRQWAARGAQVRKGETGSHIVFYQEAGGAPSEDPKNPGRLAGEPESEPRRLITKASAVFAAEQVDGFERSPPTPRDPVIVVQEADAFIAATGATIVHEGERAFYRSSTDSIHVPPPDRFTGTSTSSATESFYSTVLHELTHWTGDPSRCNRQLANRFGSEASAMEELIAELGSAFLCADLGITLTPRHDHAHYLANWLGVLRNDNRAIFTAASKASQATAYLAGLQPAQEDNTIPPLVCLAGAASAAVRQLEASRRARLCRPPEPQRAFRDC